MNISGAAQPQKLAAPEFDEAEVEMIRRCLQSGWVTQGPITSELERLMTVRHAVKHALATTSCTAALHLGAMALGFGPGDEVIVPAFTWITSAHSIEYVGARPMFVDVDLDTFNLDPSWLEQAITSRTRAIIAVHLFGLSADMDEVNRIAKRHGLKVIEDAACAIGTTYKGKPVGGLGDVGCFSFHPRKVITTGEGGMVTTHSDETAARVASFRNHGSTGQPSVPEEEKGPWTMATFDNLGFNLRLSDIQAAVGVVQFSKLDRLLAERRAAARRYLTLLEGLDELALPTQGDVSGHTYQSFVVRVLAGGRTRRNFLMRSLAAAGIETRPGTHAVHRLGYYRNKYALEPEMYPNAALAEDTTITLPIFPGITVQHQEHTVGIIRKALAETVGRGRLGRRS